MKNTYWNNNGKYQAISIKLNELVLDMGEVNDIKNNPALEKFRIASNCYYDLFNNGLCNRAHEFIKVFGFAGTYIAENNFPDCPELEIKMDEIILSAAMEQKILF